MNRIEQIYCTHCTTRACAFESGLANGVDRVVGYSVRAASEKGDKLREYYREVERFLSYELPGDTPADKKRSLRPEEAPQLLFFSPSVKNFQITGQISHRQTDTVGRLGSYFGHILVREKTVQKESWSACDCLRLWGGRRWVNQEPADQSTELKPLTSLLHMLGTRDPVIDDGVLLSYLTTPPGPWANSKDPGNVIPKRIRETDTDARRKLLVDVLEGLFGVAADPRMMLVAEPEFAALLFFGVYRLLPPGSFAQGLGFSTYESHPDRPWASLSATKFDDPKNGDLSSSWYQGRRGFALNTFTLKASPPTQKKENSIYAKEIVKILENEGWLGVERAFSALGAGPASSAEELERGISAIGLVPSLLKGSLSRVQEEVRKDGVALRVLSRSLAHQLLPTAPVTKPKLSGPARVEIIELLASGEVLPEEQEGLNTLLDSVATKELPTILQSGNVLARHKETILYRYITLHGRLPECCDAVLENAESPSAAPKGTRSFSLEAVLRNLTVDNTKRLFQNANRPAQLLLVLGEVCKNDTTKTDTIRSLLCSYISRSGNEDLYNFLQKSDGLLNWYYPNHNPVLQKRFDKLLDALPRQPEQISSRIHHLKPLQRFFGATNQEILDAWRKCLRQMEALNAATKQGTGLRVKNLNAAVLALYDPPCKELAVSFRHAIPDTRYDEEAYELRMNCLGALWKEFISDDQEIPPTKLMKFECYFEGRGWKNLPADPNPNPTDTQDNSTAWWRQSLIQAIALSLSFFAIIALIGAIVVYCRRIANGSASTIEDYNSAAPVVSPRHADAPPGSSDPGPRKAAVSHTLEPVGVPNAKDTARHTGTDFDNLQTTLDKQINELNTLLKELKSSINNLDRFQKQMDEVTFGALESPPDKAPAGSNANPNAIKKETEVKGSPLRDPKEVQNPVRSTILKVAGIVVPEGVQYDLKLEAGTSQPVLKRGSSGVDERFMLECDKVRLTITFSFANKLLLLNSKELVLSAGSEQTLRIQSDSVARLTTILNDWSSSIKAVNNKRHQIDNTLEATRKEFAQYEKEARRRQDELRKLVAHSDIESVRATKVIDRNSALSEKSSLIFDAKQLFGDNTDVSSWISAKCDFRFGIKKAGEWQRLLYPLHPRAEVTSEWDVAKIWKQGRNSEKSDLESSWTDVEVRIVFEFTTGEPAEGQKATDWMPVGKAEPNSNARYVIVVDKREMLDAIRGWKKLEETIATIVNSQRAIEQQQ